MIKCYYLLLTLFIGSLTPSTELRAIWFKRAQHAKPIISSNKPHLSAQQILKKLAGSLNSTYRTGLYWFMQDYDKYSKKEQERIIDLAITKGRSSRIIINGFAEFILAISNDTNEMPALFIPADPALFMFSINLPPTISLKKMKKGTCRAREGQNPHPILSSLSVIHKLPFLKCDITNRIYIKDEDIRKYSHQKGLVDLAGFLYGKQKNNSVIKIYEEILGPNGLQKKIPRTIRMATTYLVMINKVKNMIILTIPQTLRQKLAPSTQSFVNAALKKETKMRKTAVESLSLLNLNKQQLSVFLKTTLQNPLMGYLEMLIPHDHSQQIDPKDRINTARKKIRSLINVSTLQEIVEELNTKGF
jgi:hypothetical protein